MSLNTAENLNIKSNGINKIHDTILIKFIHKTNCNISFIFKKKTIVCEHEQCIYEMNK